MPATVLGSGLVLHDLFGGSNATAPLGAKWVVSMGEGEMKAFAGFNLGVFAPRKGKRAACKPDDGYHKAAMSKTLQGCFLQCASDAQCESVFLEHMEVSWRTPVPPVSCTLLGSIAEPVSACTNGTGTLVKRMVARPIRPDHRS